MKVCWSSNGVRLYNFAPHICRTEETSTRSAAFFFVGLQCSSWCRLVGGKRCLYWWTVDSLHSKIVNHLLEKHPFTTFHQFERFILCAATVWWSPPLLWDTWVSFSLSKSSLFSTFTQRFSQKVPIDSSVFSAPNAFRAAKAAESRFC